jgi:hypothetical protein
MFSRSGRLLTLKAQAASTDRRGISDRRKSQFRAEDLHSLYSLAFERIDIGGESNGPFAVSIVVVAMIG